MEDGQGPKTPVTICKAAAFQAHMEGGKPRAMLGKGDWNPSLSPGIKKHKKILEKIKFLENLELQ